MLTIDPSLLNAPSKEHPQVNPWKKDTWNLTDQMMISDQYPEVAERMKRDAPLEGDDRYVSGPKPAKGDIHRAPGMPRYNP